MGFGQFEAQLRREGPLEGGQMIRLAVGNRAVEIEDEGPELHHDALDPAAPVFINVHPRDVT